MARLSLITAMLLAMTLAWSAERTPSPAGAEVYFVGLKDGAKVTNPVTIHFGLKGMGIAPAGIQFDNTGHHHLLVDTEAPADLSQPIPAVENKVIHFGKGQTETTLSLAPGKHTLQLLLGDATHTPHSPAVLSQKITITVIK